MGPKFQQKDMGLYPGVAALEGYPFQSGFLQSIGFTYFSEEVKLLTRVCVCPVRGKEGACGCESVLLARGTNKREKTLMMHCCPNENKSDL